MLSTVNSRLSISRAPVSSSPSANSSTPLNKATAGSHRDTVRATLTASHVHSHKCTSQMNEWYWCNPSTTGPGQGGSSQYSQYQQGQSQQYGSYRSSQGGPGAQTQRPYAYEQVHQNTSHSPCLSGFATLNYLNDIEVISPPLMSFLMT